MSHLAALHTRRPRSMSLNMVTRKTDRSGRDGAQSTAAVRWFTLWRRLLTAVVSTIRSWFDSLASRLSPLVPSIAKRWREAIAILRGLPRKDALLQPGLAAILAMCCGVVGAGVLGMVTGSGAYAILNALVGALWVTARLVVMRQIAPGKQVDVDLVTLAWAAGSIPYAFAVVAPLRLAAWLCGGYLTARVFEKQGVTRADAWTIAALGYGAEALGVLAVWLARNLVVTALVFS